jgi:hypothetical protein
MACEDIKSKITAVKQVLDNLYQRKEAAFAEAQQAYQSYQFHKVQNGLKYSDNWKGFYNGREFSDPKALEEYAKSIFEDKKARFESLRDEFNAQIDVKDQLEKDLQACEATEATKKENNSGTGTPGTAGQGADASKTAATQPPAVTAASDPAVADIEAKNKALAEAEARGPDTLKSPTTVNASTDPALADIEAKNKAIAEAEARGPDTLKNTNAGLPGQVKNTRAQATLQDTTNFKQRKDWRVRLALSPGAQQAKYLYYSDTPGILAPLQATDGIIFPYTPSINVTYGATYNSVIPAHSNYKIFQYESSFVDSINITCDFTAQDTDEANYVLAVIHFFRSVTKMFYGQDQFPKPGTPPPLCYLFGLGEFQFNAHPLAITNFTYNLPTDVDYIRAGAITATAGVSRAPEASAKKPKKTNPFQAVGERLAQNAVKKIGGVAGGILSKLIPGGQLAGPNFNGSQNSTGFNSTVPPGTKDPTYVPTKISISISAVPIVSRYDISNRFSVQDYASGKLLNGTKQAGGGIW